jgi:hypothetical protein
LGQVYANSGRSGFTVNNDRAGKNTLEVTLAEQCDTSGATDVGGSPIVDGARRFASQPGAQGAVDQTWYDVLPGGCITTHLHSNSAEPEVNADVSRQAPAIVGQISRAALARALDSRSGGRLDLDPD